MANEDHHSRRAWDLITSHRDGIYSGNEDMDEYLNNGADIGELIDGWRAVLAHQPSDVLEQHSGSESEAENLEAVGTAYAREQVDSATNARSGIYAQHDSVNYHMNSDYASCQQGDTDAQERDLEDAELQMEQQDLNSCIVKMDSVDVIDLTIAEANANISECVVHGHLLSHRPNHKVIGCGNDERFVLYPDLNDIHPDPTLSDTTLGEQIAEFVRNKMLLHQERVRRWRYELSSSTGSDNFCLLPDELLLHVFSYIPLKELCTTIAMVCKQWYIISSDASLWQHLIIPPDTTFDPHWLCFFAAKSPHLKTLSVRGGRNMHPECISSIANNCQDLRTIDLGFGNTTQQMLTDLVTSCPRVSSVNFEGCECADSEWIKTLCQFKELRFIDISHCMMVLDDDIIYLSENTTDLISINIDGNSLLSDRAVIPLCHRHWRTLRLLSIDGAESTDRSMEAVSQCKFLLRLTVSFAENLSNKSIDYCLALDSLEHLQIRKNQNMTSGALRKLFLGTSMSHLVYLDLSECLYVDDEVVLAICKCCQSLTRLMLCWCWNITDRGLEHIVTQCRNMCHLDLLGIDQIEGGSFDLLPQKLSNLTFLNLVQCNRIKDDLIKDVLDRMPQLTAINFYHEDFRTTM